MSAARRFAILGFPLGHTMSPPIHRRLFELSGHRCDGYDVLEIPPEQLDTRLPELKALAGLNVTIPHKVAMLSRVDRLDETARRYGALNVTAWEQGELVGYNTDCYGFRKTLEVMGVCLEPGLNVCVLGAGGVGRMFAMECALAGARVTLAVRESGHEDAQQVLRELFAQAPGAQAEIVSLAALAGGYDLLINATPAGMYPHTDSMAVSPAALAGCAFVFDCVYNPTRTRLLQEAERAGARTEGGMAMLVWQAVRAHELWDGAHYAPEQITALIEELSALVTKQFQA